MCYCFNVKLQVQLPELMDLCAGQFCQHSVQCPTFSMCSPLLPVCTCDVGHTQAGPGERLPVLYTCTVQL